MLPFVFGSVVSAACAARAFCSSWRICLRFLLRRAVRGLEGWDLNGRGNIGVGWPKSRASRLTEGVGVAVPDGVGEGWAILHVLRSRCQSELALRPRLLRLWANLRLSVGTSG